MKTIGNCDYPETPSELKAKMLKCIEAQMKDMKMGQNTELWMLHGLNECDLSLVHAFIKSFFDETDLAEAEAYEIELAKEGSK